MRNGKWVAVRDGKQGKPYDEVLLGRTPFSEDGRHLAYAARSGGKWRLVMDNRESEEYIGAIPPSFSSAKSACCIATRLNASYDAEAVRVEMEAEE
jgi:hypothetical protein